ncbi:hypothetical protein RQP46_002526 [Phenoliferia psychrophenolica]
MTARWLVKGAHGIYPSDTCTAQATLIQLGDLGSAFGSLLIGTHVALVLVWGYKIPKRVLYGIIVLQWVLVAFMAAIGPLLVQQVDAPFYDWGGACPWPRYQLFKLWFRYLWVCIVGAALFIIYGIIFVKLARGSNAILGERRNSNGGTRSAALVMIFYPLVYTATVLPLACFRLAALAGHAWSVDFQLAAGVIFTLSGFANCLVCTFTRNIVTSDTVYVVRRTGSVDFLRVTSQLDNIRRGIGTPVLIYPGRR